MVFDHSYSEMFSSDWATIPEALGVIDPDGKPTALVQTEKAAELRV